VLLSLLVIQLLLLPKENGGCRLEVATLMAGCSCCRGTLCGQVVRIGLVGFAFAICYLLFVLILILVRTQILIRILILDSLFITVPGCAVRVCVTTECSLTDRLID